jgi:hypothetical protein
VNTLARYLEVIVDPTWDDFHANRDSPRLAFLTCVAICHAVDRVAEADGKNPAHFRQIWGKESLHFKLVDEIGHHLKHVLSSIERKEIALSNNMKNLEERFGNPPISWIVGFDENGEMVEPRRLHPIIRDAVRFVHKKAGTVHPSLP